MQIEKESNPMKRKLVPNFDLTVTSENRKKIENAGYSYFDFSKEEIQKLADSDPRDITYSEYCHLVQALFPDFMIASGIFDSYLLFTISQDCRRIDPPKYFFNSIVSYEDNKEGGSNQLISLVKDLFDNNGILASPSWIHLFLITIGKTMEEAGSDYRAFFLEKKRGAGND